MRSLIYVAFGWFLGCSSATALARDWHVAPEGNAKNAGTLDSPWDLATALAENSQPASPNHALAPGDTLWLHTGTYRGSFTCRLLGTKQQPIVVRAWPGERATIDHAEGEGISVLSGGYVWFWGLEFSAAGMKRRSTQTGSFPTDLATGVHLSLGNAPGLKAINNIFRDAAGAVGSSSTATDVEVTGNLMCYGGWFANDRTHGHGVYAQNRTGTKRFANNVVFWNASHGMHAYGSPAAGVQQFVMENNTFFNNGELFDDTLRGRNFLLGGGATTSDCRVLNNLLYRAQPRVEHSSSDFMLGFATGMTNCVIRGNYVVGQTYLSGPFQNVKIVDNTFQGSMFSDPARRVAELYPENRYTPQRPAVEQVFVRPNEHEPQCGTITIFNWPKAERVRVDITPLGLAAGDRYELRSAIDYFGDVTFGVLSGQEIEVGMTNHTVVPPANLPTPPTPFPEFGVFLLRKLPSEPGNQAAERR